MSALRQCYFFKLLELLIMLRLVGSLTEYNFVFELNNTSRIYIETLLFIMRQSKDLSNLTIAACAANVNIRQKEFEELKQHFFVVLILGFITILLVASTEPIMTIIPCVSMVIVIIDRMPCLFKANMAFHDAIQCHTDACTDHFKLERLIENFRHAAENRSD